VLLLREIPTSTSSPFLLLRPFPWYSPLSLSLRGKKNNRRAKPTFPSSLPISLLSSLFSSSLLYATTIWIRKKWEMKRRHLLLPIFSFPSPFPLSPPLPPLIMDVVENNKTLLAESSLFFSSPPFPPHDLPPLFFSAFSQARK